jgi:hypothetical protein
MDFNLLEITLDVIVALQSKNNAQEMEKYGEMGTYM